jgi:hypothetical protein
MHKWQYLLMYFVCLYFGVILMSRKVATGAGPMFPGLAVTLYRKFMQTIASLLDYERV